MSTKRLITAIASAVLLGTTAVALATVVVHHDSRVTITKTMPYFAGKVHSPEPACQSGRRVTLNAVEPGESVGSDQTNADGEWRINFQGEGVVHYFAKVKRRSDGTAGTIHVCKSDRSPVIAAP